MRQIDGYCVIRIQWAVVMLCGMLTIGLQPALGWAGAMAVSLLAAAAVGVVNGIGCLGYGFEVQIFINGVILATVVLCEAYAIHRHELLKGQRPDLLREIEEECVSGIVIAEEVEEEGDAMCQKDRVPLLVSRTRVQKG